MKFSWSDEKIAFMRDASLYSNYHKELSEVIATQLKECNNICDVGCGLGFLSCELAKYFQKVTAIDISEQATKLATQMREERKIDNLEIKCLDMIDGRYDMNFDGMVFCFFGSINEVLEIANRYKAKKIVIIKKAYKYHRFSIERKEISGETGDKAIEKLKEKNFKFSAQTYTFEFGQPFISIEDAVKFYKLYNNSDDEIDCEKVKSTLANIDDNQFCYYLPKEKKVNVITINIV